MKNILLLTTSPTVGGNGDALMQAAAEAARECGAEIRHSVAAQRTEVFTGCASSDTCRNSAAYLDSARNIARWVCA